jgi:hypothetical protein
MDKHPMSQIELIQCPTIAVSTLYGGGGGSIQWIGKFIDGFRMVAKIGNPGVELEFLNLNSLEQKAEPISTDLCQVKPKIDKTLG